MNDQIFTSKEYLKLFASKYLAFKTKELINPVTLDSYRSKRFDTLPSLSFFYPPLYKKYSQNSMDPG